MTAEELRRFLLPRGDLVRTYATVHPRVIRMRPIPDPNTDYSPDSVVTSEELRKYLRASPEEWLRLRAKRAWREPQRELPPPVLGGNRGSLDGLRWRMADVVAWLEERADGYRTGDL